MIWIEGFVESEIGDQEARLANRPCFEAQSAHLGQRRQAARPHRLHQEEPAAARQRDDLLGPRFPRLV